MARKRKYFGPALEQHGAGHWRFEVSVNGERHKVSVYAEDRSEAEEKAPELRRAKLAELNAGSVKGVGALTVHQALDTFLAAKYDPERDAKGHANHASMVRVLKQRFDANDLMVDIDDEALTDLIDERKTDIGRKDKPVSAATVNRTVIELLSRAFRYFEKSRKYRFPNKPDFKEHKLHEGKGRIRYLSDAEYDDLTNIGNRDFLAVVDFALMTGFRRANTLLRWDQVKITELADGTLAGTATVKVKSQGPEKEIVEFDLPDAACRLILTRRNADGTPHHPEWVFTFVAERSRDGRVQGARYPITESGLQAWWQRHRREVGLPDLRFHDLRHTAATTLLRETGDITVVQRALGHADVKTTSRYAHVLRETVQSGLNRAANGSRWGRSYQSPPPDGTLEHALPTQSPQNPAAVADSNVIALPISKTNQKAA